MVVLPLVGATVVVRLLVFLELKVLTWQRSWA